jgi:PST family polysaccharide transporter
VTRDDTPSRILRSAGAAAASQLWRTAVVFAVHLVLRHLVAPQDWGLWDWTQAVFLVLAAARDLGLPAHTLRVRPSPFGTLLRFQATWGPALALLVFAGAPLLARGFAAADPTLVGVVRACCLYLVIEGLAQVPVMWFEGELRLDRTLPAEIARSLAFAAVSITLALLDFGVWSLVLGHLAAAALFAALVWARAWGRLPKTRHAGPLLALLRGGVTLGVIWLLALLVKYVDPLILGARFPTAVVGTYGFAYWIAFLATTLLVQPVGRALYPALLGFAGEPARAFETYRLATLLLLALEVPAALVLFLNADLAVQLLGGGAWAGAPDLLRLLCFVPLLDPLGRFAGDLFVSRHQDRVWIAANLATLLALAVAGIFLTGWLGPRGMALANYLPLGSLLVAWGLRRIAAGAFGRLLRELASLYLIPLPLFAAVWVAAGPRPLLRLALSLAAAAVTFALYARRFGGSYRDFFRGAAVSGK